MSDISDLLDEFDDGKPYPFVTPLNTWAGTKAGRQLAKAIRLRNAKIRREMKLKHTVLQ